MSADCIPVQYALVAYVKNALGEFVEGLRRELHPVHAHLPTHLTVLPPRPLQGSEEDAIAMLRKMAARVAPFQVDLGEVESFLPTTPTVFIRVSFAGYRMRELHDLLNRDGLAFTETLPYMPHVTVAKLDSNERAAEVLRISKERWEHYPGSHRISVERLTFVRGSQHTWTDLADIILAAPLGNRLTPELRCTARVDMTVFHIANPTDSTLNDSSTALTTGTLRNLPTGVELRGFCAGEASR